MPNNLIIKTSIPTWLWLGLPIVIVLAQIISKAVDEDFYRDWFRSETGLVENLTVLFLVLAIITALRLFTKRQQVCSRLFGPFVLIMALGCLYFAGEEASWGQHWIGFQPPESIAERNDQGEFNIHNDPNFEAFTDQLPRLLLTLAALFGGILAPLIRRGKDIDLQSQTPFGWLWPTYVCMPAAIGAVFITLPNKLVEMAGYGMMEWMDISEGETKEFFLALFLFLYLPAAAPTTLTTRLTARKPCRLPAAA